MQYETETPKMPEPLNVPLGKSKAEFMDRGSRFISYGVPNGEADEVKGLLQHLRTQHSGCSHVVHAWRIGLSGDIFGYSDDGEPKGTAGRPVFEVLKGSGATNLLIAVVRYFGGTKLGTGGLVRAYTESAKRAVAGLRTEPLIERSAFAVSVPYSLFEQTKRILLSHQAQIKDERFEIDVAIIGIIPVERFKECGDDITNLSAGSASLMSVDE